MKAYVPGASVEAGRGSSGRKARQAAGLTFSLKTEMGAEQAGTLSSAWSQLPSQSVAVSFGFGGSAGRPGAWPEREHLLGGRDHVTHISVPHRADTREPVRRQAVVKNRVVPTSSLGQVTLSHF